LREVEVKQGYTVYKFYGDEIISIPVHRNRSRVSTKTLYRVENSFFNKKRYRVVENIVLGMTGKYISNRLSEEALERAHPDVYHAVFGPQVVSL
jgi:hypothetical protein